MRCPGCAQEVPAQAKFCPRCGRGLQAFDAIPTDEAWVIGSRLLTRYRLEAPLGEGGMGEVWKAHDERMDLPVALKRLPAHLRRDTQGQRQLQTEAKLAIRLNHPGLIRLYNLEEAPAGQFLVMEYVAGPTLAERLAERGPLAPEELRALAPPLCEALAYAHAQGVLHRDLKPGNILLASTGPKLADFGIACTVRETLHRLTGVAQSGTLPYMAPEQIQGEPPTPQTDLYQLAATFYECCAGHPPFYQGALEWQILNKLPPALPDVPAPLAAALLAALAKDPADRPAGVAAFRTLLTRPAASATIAQARQQAEQAAQRKAAEEKKRQEAEAAAAAKRQRQEKVRQAEARRQAELEAQRKAAEEKQRQEAEAKAAEERRRQEADAKAAAERARRPAPGTIQRRGTDHAEMVYVPAGTVWMGSGEDDQDAYNNERPRHQVTLPAFWLDKTPVTNAQFARFIQATGYNAEGNWQNYAADKDTHPVVDVTWADAQAYCRWAQKRLPTEAEWEYAARGTDGRKYPWGSTWDKSRANSLESGHRTTTPVGAYPSGASPFGILDLAGNVCEWTSTLFKPYPYSATDGREDPNASGPRVFRGGSWVDLPRYLRSAVRSRSDPTSRSGNVGFRCAQGVQQ